MKGFREKPQGSKNDVLRSLQTEVQNLQMATRVSQMLMKRFMTNEDNMGKDLGAALAQITELQYKLNALIKTQNVDPQQVAAAANVQRLADFEKGSTEADLKEGLLSADTVGDESTVVITSTTDDTPDSGIFRSRIRLTDTGIPALIKGLMGQPVGTKLDVDIAGKTHHVELLAIRNPDPALAVTEVPVVVEQEAAPTLN